VSDLGFFREIWLVDFEFTAPPGERPSPICLVAREHHSGQTIRLAEGDLIRCKIPPFTTSPDALFVAYYASAELGCFQALRWPMPTRILDLYAEFRRHTSGLAVPCGWGLLGALAYHGIDGIDAADKKEMRELAQRGGPYTAVELAGLLEYCESDVVALQRLLPAMAPRIDLPRALLRGRYMAAAARIEWTGVPIDVKRLTELRSNWVQIKTKLTDEVDRDFGCYGPTGASAIGARSFSTARFAQWLSRQAIPWPRLPSGALDLSDEAFRQMSRQHSAVAPLRELRHSLSQLRLNELAVGGDGRNRCLLSAFASRTGRNQPSNVRFIFGPSVWLRGLIQPGPGRAVAYVDWNQQEFGIAGALSGDTAMMAAYSSGDPYLEFAKQAGVIPADATKDSHKAERERFKVCALAVQYGMAEASLAASLGQTEAHARDLLRLHRETYPTFWRWSHAAVDHAMMHSYLETVFGWRVHVSGEVNPRSLANFPMQANGAEMLRLACCLLTERGIAVCAPIHDAVLIEADANAIVNSVAACQAAMREASMIVLDGFALRTDVKIVSYPDRYADPRGAQMWDTIDSLLTQLRGVPSVG
jgi:hypothetical protein